MKLAKEINAIYQRTSAKSDSGCIDELFMNIGKKILEPDSVIESNLTKAEKKQRGKILLKQQQNEKTSRIYQTVKIFLLFYQANLIKISYK